MESNTGPVLRGIKLVFKFQLARFEFTSVIEEVTLRSWILSYNCFSKTASLKPTSGGIVYLIAYLD